MRCQSVLKARKENVFTLDLPPQHSPLVPFPVLRLGSRAPIPSSDTLNFEDSSLHCCRSDASPRLVVDLLYTLYNKGL